MVKYLNICTKKTWTKDGKEQVKWLQCGTLKLMDDNKKFIELNMFPNTAFYCFEPKKKEEKSEYEG